MFPENSRACHDRCLSDYLVNHDANSKSTMIRRKGHHLNDHLNVRHPPTRCQSAPAQR